MSLRRFFAILGILLGSGALGMSFSLVNANLATVKGHFQGSILELQWMINIYGICIASCLVTMGRLGDLFGRKRLFLAGLLAFVIAMLGSGLANSLGTIIGFMALYGLSGAILLPISQAMIIEVFEDRHKSRAIGIWATFSGLSMAVGPLIGGLVTTYLSWSWIFFINVPVALLAALLIAFAAHESRSDDTRLRVDWLGGVFLALTIGALILGVIQSNLWPRSLIYGIFGFALLSLVALLITEKKVQMPIIREDLFTHRTFLISALSAFCMTALFWTSLFLIPLYVQDTLGYDSIKTGILMLFFTLPGAILSSPSAFLYEKIGARIQIFLGFLICAVSTYLFIRFGHLTTFGWISVATLLMAVGFTFILTPAMTAGLSTLSKQHSGVASGTFVTVQEIGGSLGLALAVTAVRLHPGQDLAFHYGVYVMLGFALLGLIGALFMKNRPKQREHLQRDWTH